MDFAPTRSFCCGLNLRTGVSILIAIDLFFGMLNFADQLGWLFHVGYSTFHFLQLVGLCLSVGGATFAVLGLSKKRPDWLNIYALTLLVRLIVSFAVTAFDMVHLRQTAEYEVDGIIAGWDWDAHEHHHKPHHVDREAMVDKLVGVLAVWVIGAEVVKAAGFAYCAYVVRSLAVWMQNGEENPEVGRVYQLSVQQTTSSPLLQRAEYSTAPVTV